jgi:hypothetical protein
LVDPWLFFLARGWKLNTNSDRIRVIILYPDVACVLNLMNQYFNVFALAEIVAPFDWSTRKREKEPIELLNE